jgi:hypothetical protein
MCVCASQKSVILPAHGRCNSARSGGRKPPVGSTAPLGENRTNPGYEPGEAPVFRATGIILVGENRPSATASVHATKSGGRKPPVATAGPTKSGGRKPPVDYLPHAYSKRPNSPHCRCRRGLQPRRAEVCGVGDCNCNGVTHTHGGLTVANCNGVTHTTHGGLTARRS